MALSYATHRGNVAQTHTLDTRQQAVSLSFLTIYFQHCNYLSFITFNVCGNDNEISKLYNFSC